MKTNPLLSRAVLITLGTIIFLLVMISIARSQTDIRQTLRQRWMSDGENHTTYDVSSTTAAATLNGRRNIDTYNQTGGDLTIISGNSVILQSGGALAGGGVMNLGYSYLYQTAAGVVFTITNGTIQGYGEIGYNGLALLVQPNGIASANTAGQTLSLNSSGVFTNNGGIRATGGGTLTLSGSSDVQNASGTIRSADGPLLQSGQLKRQRRQSARANPVEHPGPGRSRAEHLGHDHRRRRSAHRPAAPPPLRVSGNFQFTDNTALPQRFYRVVYP